MMKTQLLLFLYTVIFVSFGETLPIEDYYWKDYNGIVPEDAFDCNTTLLNYIGAVPILGYGGVFIGGLQNGVNEITVAGYNRHTDKRQVYTRYQYIRILCSATPEKLQWIDTTAHEFASLPYTPILGGYDDDVSYVGRLLYPTGNIAAYGRISPTTGYSLHYVHDSAPVDTKSYQVLVYNPSK